MNKYDNHIYLIICEVTIDLYHASKFTTYNGYCSLMKNNINSKSISRSQKKDIFKIFKVLSKTFNLDDKAIGVYVDGYFCSEKYLKFEKVVLITKEALPNLEPIINILS